jgi:hypothetical protein
MYLHVSQAKPQANKKPPNSAPRNNTPSNSVRFFGNRHVAGALAFADNQRAENSSRCSTAKPAQIQRKCAKCEDEKEQSIFKKSTLPISHASDPFEREADRVADQVMQTGSSVAITSDGVDATAPVIRTKAMSASAQTAAALPPNVQGAINSSSSALDAGTRGFMESRMHQDFSSVRVHSNDIGIRTAASLNARAYTVGNHIVFGANQYQPHSVTGRRLLAHELVHVAQSGNSDLTIRRAEVEDRPSVCSGLTDIKTDVNNFVNGEIGAARLVPGTLSVIPFLREVLSRTGGAGPIGPVETFIEGLPATKRFLPGTSLSGTRFSRLPTASGLGIPGIMGMNIYDAHRLGFAHVVGSTALINGICAGADKLGHFFQQGADYFSIAARTTVADAESFGRATEIDRAGLGATGVYSNADLAANLSGLQFWRDLQAAPTTYRFDVANYINSSWNEYSNPNFYERSIAEQIWPIQLRGAWSGVIGTMPALDDISISLTATARDIRGTYSRTAAPPGLPITGTIRGRIRFNTTPVTGSISSSVLHGSSGSHSATPVSGITITFDWNEGTRRGKGVWNSTSENRLVGTFGTGSSRTNAGILNIEKP